MRQSRIPIAALASLVLLSGCESSGQLGGLFQGKKSDDALATGSAAGAADGANAGLLGSDPYDDLNTGKKLYRAGNYGLAERSFRRAVESHPRDAEAWLGLAAAYDQLRRFDLADRAYDQVVALVGETAEVLNNRGYSYMLRGDYARARTILKRAQAMDPANPYVQNNITLLEASTRKRKAIR